MNGTPEGSCPEAKGLGYFAPTGLWLPPHSSWRKGVHTFQVSLAEAPPVHQRQPQRSRRPRGGCPCHCIGMGWASWCAVASASGGHPRVRPWPLVLMICGNAGPTSYLRQCCGSPAWSWAGGRTVALPT